MERQGQPGLMDGTPHSMERLPVPGKKFKPVMAGMVLGLLFLGGCTAAPAVTPSTAVHTEWLCAEQARQPRGPEQNSLERPAVPSPPPSTTKPAETRGKYSNTYDRRIPLQGDTHKGYAPARRDPFKR